MVDRVIDQTTAYARAVVGGELVAGPHVRAAARRHLEDLAHGDARGLAWDVDSAERAIGFFRDVLTVEIEERDEFGAVESRAVPFGLQAWQAFIVGSIFGWKNGDGLRRFRRAYVEIGKGNGKSPLAAGIGLYMLTAQRKLRAEVYSAATSRDQAAILFRDVVAMWERSRALNRRLTPSGENPVWQLTHQQSGSFFRPISSDKKGKSGIRPYCALVDEVHEHPDNTVIEMLRAGTKGNQEALMFEITNSGFDRRSVCWQEHEYTVKVLDGRHDNDAWFGFIASLDEGDDPFEDEECWIKANPNLGVSIHRQFVREQVLEARGIGSKEAYVRRLHFCQWTESDAAAISRAVWMPALQEFDPDELADAGYPCFGGLDLSRAMDLTAFTLVWLLDAARDKWRFAAKTWFWTPGDTLTDRQKLDRQPYDAWVKAGHMRAIPGPRIRYNWVAGELASLCAQFEPITIGCDQYGLEQLSDHLDEIGVSLPCVVHPQGFKARGIGKKEDGPEGAEEVKLWMPDSINKLEAALLERRIWVEPNPVMTMCATGVVYKPNHSGHRMFAKDEATTRIDGMVSLAMAIGVATTGARTVKRSYLETSELMVL